MSTSMKKLYITVFFCASFVLTFAQSPNASSEKTFYDYKNEFEEFWGDRPDAKGKGYKQYKR